MTKSLYKYPADDTVGTMLASSEMVAEDDVDEESGPLSPPGTILISFHAA